MIPHPLIIYLKTDKDIKAEKEFISFEQSKKNFFQRMLELSKLKKKQNDYQDKRKKLEEEIIVILNKNNLNLNEKIPTLNIFPLDIAIEYGSPNLIELLLKKDAMPTLGWKFETLDNFKNARFSVLFYLYARSCRNDSESLLVKTTLEKFLQEREHQKMNKKNAEETFELMKSLSAVSI